MFLDSFLQNLRETSRVLLISWSVLIVFELLFPLERQSFKSYLRGLRTAAVVFPIASLVTTVMASVIQLHLVKPILIIKLPGFLKPYSPLLWMFLGDICYYWMHRFQHTKFWWRFHRPHHQLKEVNAVNSSSHWMESFTGFVFSTIPMAFVSIPDIPYTIPIFSFLFVWGFFIHANTRLHLGVFRFIFADPRYHRIHHSMEERHFDKNYAAYFAIIDVIFGTAYFPKKEKVKTGIEGEEEPRPLLFLR
jgi:sterol desaturase/sphingolipid hydroxylase (fatty acid hydroxylase superfamily)